MEDCFQQYNKKLIELSKQAFDRSLSSLNLFEEQTLKVINGFYEQASWLPEEGKRLVDEWFIVSRQGLESYKLFIDEQYQKMLGLLYSR